MGESGAPHIPWRARPARWLATRSLRGQLISGLVALLALACAGVGLVTYIVISHTLLSQLDYQLQDAGGRYASCMEAHHHEGPPLPQGATAANCNTTPGLNTGTFGARVKDGMVTDQGIIGGQSHLSAAGTVELTVTDNGPGIAPQLQPALFERFVRGDSSRSRGTTGAASTGLGLAIVNAVTTAHGGHVQVHSEPGHTQFTITLPRLDG